MLIFDLRIIGNRLFEIRREKNMTRAEVAETAGLSDRTYADIERGSVNMRLETLLKICMALGITPNEILTEGEYSFTANEDAVFLRLSNCTLKEKETALKILTAFLDGLD